VAEFWANGSSDVTALWSIKSPLYSSNGASLSLLWHFYSTYMATGWSLVQDGDKQRELSSWKLQVGKIKTSTLIFPISPSQHAA
jgi:hypothetical protein